MPGEPLLSSWGALVPVTRGEMGRPEPRKLKLSRERERLERGVNTGVSIGVLLSDRSWTPQVSGKPTRVIYLDVEAEDGHVSGDMRALRERWRSGQLCIKYGSLFRQMSNIL